MCCLLIAITFVLFIRLQSISNRWKSKKVFYSFVLQLRVRFWSQKHPNQIFGLLHAIKTDLTMVAFVYELPPLLLHKLDLFVESNF
jgi:hypothetical protein